MSVSHLPALPPAVAEWEDLLVRFEIMTRALRVALEDASAAAEVLDTLRGLVAREAAAAHWLSAVSHAGGSVLLPPAEPGPALDALYQQFASLRARNFAMVQRRGLDVWAWAHDLAGEGEVTAYQLLTYLVQEDAAALAALREAARRGPAAC